MTKKLPVLASVAKLARLHNVTGYHFPSTERPSIKTASSIFFVI